MHPSDEKPISVLNKLLVVNSERLEGYLQASERTDVSILKVLFSRLTETSLQCREELCREVYKLGGVPQTLRTGTGEFQKAWNEIRTALDNNNYKALLDSCYIEEFMAHKSYEYALRYYQQHITSQQLRIVSRQKGLLRADQRKVRNLREVLMKAA